MKLFPLSILLCLLLVLIPMTGSAGAINFEHIKQDFKPVDGVLVMPLANEWLVDVDAEQNVSPGDLFSVIEKGQPVLHPKTKELIGYIEATRSVLKITKIKSGYSYATIIKEDGELKPGLPVRSYAGLTARMLDTSNQGRAIYNDLQAAVPHLEWVSYASAEKAAVSSVDLLFRYDDTGLTVLDSENSPLRFYPTQQSVAAVAQQMPGQVVAPNLAARGGIVVAQSSQATAARGGIVRAQVAAQDGIWRSQPFNDVAVGMDVADLDGDGQQEIAVLTATSIGVVRLIEGEYKQIAHYDLPNATKALALDAADLDGNGHAELYLTASRGHVVASTVLELTGRTLKEIVSGLPYYFRNTSLHGEGRVLLGQRFGGHDSPFAGPVFRVQRRGAEVAAGTTLSLPKNTNIYSFAAMGNSMVARLKQKSLAVSSPTGDLWDGSAFNAASEIFINFLDPNDRSQLETLPFFISPRLIAVENAVVLATEHKEKLLSNRFQTFGQGRVAAYQWDGSSMRELWHTQPQSGYLADFGYADADNDGKKEIVGFFTFGREGLMNFSSGRSALMTFELN